MEHRAKLLDIAAFLDRVERAAPAGGGSGEDFRVRALKEALAILLDGKGQRARRVLEHFSDPSEKPIAAAHTKGASGVYPGAARTGEGGA